MLPERQYQQFPKAAWYPKRRAAGGEVRKQNARHCQRPEGLDGSVAIPLSRVLPPRLRRFYSYSAKSLATLARHVAGEDIKCLLTETKNHHLTGCGRSGVQGGNNEARGTPPKRPTVPNAKELVSCELTGTFLITFKKPDRAGKTGSMRRCEK
jgi:hypothetical protein